MTELLKRWADLEPDRCLIGPPTSHICAEVILGAVPQLVLFDQHKRTASQEAALLAAVIEAIEARGWFWNVGTTMQPPVQAYVQSPERTFRPVRAETPAAALLGAYVAALEAEGEEQA